MKITTKKLYVCYKIENDDGQEITALIYPEIEKISLVNQYDSKKFVFLASDAKMVKAIAQLMIKSTELVKKEKEQS